MKYQPAIVAAFFKSEGLPPHVTEHHFADGIVKYVRKDGRLATRQWAFDFAFLEQRVALEVEGGIWTGGGHSRGSGVAKDMEKYNAATLLGWRVLRCQPSELCTMETVRMLQKMFGYIEIQHAHRTTI